MSLQLLPSFGPRSRFVRSAVQAQRIEEADFFAKQLREYELRMSLC
jgi:hypothetical protein